jgi:Zinc finger, C3HC4 type (RING finger)
MAANPCEDFLRQFNVTGAKLLGSYVSYMTGLYYNKTGPPPQEDQVYSCQKEKQNSYDPNAIGIYSNRGQRMAYVPKDLTGQLAFDPKDNILLCYCTGPVTARSAQCVYNLYQIQHDNLHQIQHDNLHQIQHDNLHQIQHDNLYQPQQPQQQVCIMCSASAATCVFNPCKHTVVCNACGCQLVMYKTRDVKTCPICQQSIQSIVISCL